MNWQTPGINLSTHHGFSMCDHFEYELDANTLGKEKLAAAEQKLNQRIHSDQDQIQAQQLTKESPMGTPGRSERCWPPAPRWDAQRVPAPGLRVPPSGGKSAAVR